MDPLLNQRGSDYGFLLDELMEAGIIEASSDGKETSGIFFEA